MSIHPHCMSKRTATNCNTLQHTTATPAPLSCVRQHTATHRNTLQHTSLYCKARQQLPHLRPACVNTLQHTATHRNTLHHTATHDSNSRASALQQRLPRGTQPSGTSLTAPQVKEEVEEDWIDVICKNVTDAASMDVTLVNMYQSHQRAVDAQARAKRGDLAAKRRSRRSWHSMRCVCARVCVCVCRCRQSMCAWVRKRESGRERARERASEKGSAYTHAHALSLFLSLSLSRFLSLFLSLLFSLSTPLPLPLPRLTHDHSHP